MRVYSYGGVVIWKDKVLICHPTNRSGKVTLESMYWRLPKGGKSDDENPEEAAIREVFEETGVKCEIISLIGNTTPYKTTKNKRRVTKVAVFYEMQPVTITKFIPNREMDEIKWVTFNELPNYLVEREYDIVRQCFEQKKKSFW